MTEFTVHQIPASPGKLEIPAAAYAAGELAALRYVAEGDALDVASDVLHAAIPLDRDRQRRVVDPEAACVDPAGLVPAPTQATVVAVLDALSRPLRVVDAAPVPDVADEPCGNDWSHGLGIVYGGPCPGLCLPCAVAAVMAAAWDATSPDVVSLDVLRHPVASR